MDVIPGEYVLTGAYMCLHNADFFLKMSDSLFEARLFQASIPFSTISVEESLKGCELALAARTIRDVSSTKWKKLKQHSYKLTNLQTLASEKLIATKRDELGEVAKELGFSPLIDHQGLLKHHSMRSKSLSNFKYLRELCFYCDWEPDKSCWIVFSEIPIHTQELIGYYALQEAEGLCNYLEFQIERAINILRKRGIKLGGLQFPTYNEVREFSKYESTTKLFELRKKMDMQKYTDGATAFSELLNKRGLSQIHP